MNRECERTRVGLKLSCRSWFVTYSLGNIQFELTHHLIQGESNISHLQDRWGADDLKKGMYVLRDYVAKNWKEGWRQYANILTPPVLEETVDEAQTPALPRVRQSAVANNRGRVINSSTELNRRSSMRDIRPAESYQGPVTRKRAREQSGVETVGEISPSRAPAVAKRVSVSPEVSKRVSKVTVEVPRYKHATRGMYLSQTNLRRRRFIVLRVITIVDEIEPPWCSHTSSYGDRSHSNIHSPSRYSITARNTSSREQFHEPWNFYNPGRSRDQPVTTSN